MKCRGNAGGSGKFRDAHKDEERFFFRERKLSLNERWVQVEALRGESTWMEDQRSGLEAGSVVFLAFAVLAGGELLLSLLVEVGLLGSGGTENDGEDDCEESHDSHEVCDLSHLAHVLEVEAGQGSRSEFLD